MRKPKILAALCLALALAPAGFAQTPLDELPGYFPLEDLGILGEDELRVEINLMRPLLRLVAAGVRADEPEFAELLADLDAVRVRVASLEDLDVREVRGNLARAAGWLEDHGWQTTVRMHEDDEDLYIYLREVDGEIAGLAILALEAGGEAAVINIVGRMEPSQLERLGETLDIPQLGAAAGPVAEPETEEGPDR